MLTKINICCGANIFPFEGWNNLDKEDLNPYFNFLKHAPLTGMPEHQQRVANYLKLGNNPNFKIHDITRGLPQYSNQSVDLLYFGQALEHFNSEYQIPNILKEFYRILKPGGILRITTPSLKLLLSAYNENKMDQFINEQPAYYKTANKEARLSYLLFGSTGPNCQQNNYEGHFHIYDEETLTKILNNAGFTQIYFYNETEKSQNEIMARECKDFGLNHSLICETIK